MDIRPKFWVAFAALFAALVTALTSAPVAYAEIGCSATARFAYLACDYGARDDYFASVAICLDNPNIDTTECTAEANAVLVEDDEECADVLAARMALCETLSDAPHEPAFGEDFADQFVDPRTIGSTTEPNPYLPLVVGNRWVYEGEVEDDDGEIVIETITIEVLNETKMIDGVACIVVNDVVLEDGELIEDTDDWFAQDVDGNVWYCGEESKDYEIFEEDNPALPELVSDDGSFKHGNDDGDKAGLLIPFTPVVGDYFRQEVSVSNAEDVIEIIATDGNETTVAASCDNNCLVTRDFTPIEPDVEENKYYLPGVGKILEIDLESGERFELIEFDLN